MAYLRTEADCTRLGHLCPGSTMTPGVIGGMVCNCPCHRTVIKDFLKSGENIMSKFYVENDDGSKTEYRLRSLTHSFPEVEVVPLWQKVLDPAYMPRWWFYVSCVLTAATALIIIIVLMEAK